VFPETVEFSMPCGALRLRPTSTQDSADIARSLEDARVARYLAALPCPLDDEALNAYLKFLCGPGQISKTMMLNGQFAGIVSLSSQLSFWVAYENWRKGLASCAVNWFIKTHFAQNDVLELQAEVHSSNVASLTLLKRIGFEQFGPVKRRFSFVLETSEDFIMLKLSRTSWCTHQE
jgi:RimJ/RimL family protein N-acetyltransferase